MAQLMKRYKHGGAHKYLIMADLEAGHIYCSFLCNHLMCFYPIPTDDFKTKIHIFKKFLQINSTRTFYPNLIPITSYDNKKILLYGFEGSPKSLYIYISICACCCCLPCNHCSNWTQVVKEILTFGTRLRSTHCKKLNYLKLCGPAYFVRTTQLCIYKFRLSFQLRYV